MSYSRFINGLKRAGVGLDRKQLAALAMARDPLFAELVRTAENALKAAAPETKAA